MQDNAIAGRRIMPAGPLLLTYQDAAAELGVSLATFMRLLRAGQFTPVTLDTGYGRTKRVRRADLLDYVDGLTEAPA